MSKPVVLIEQIGGFTYEDENGNAVEGVLVTMMIPKAELDTDAYNFDPTSASSPPAAECRAYARPLVEAYIAKLNEVNP